MRLLKAVGGAILAIGGGIFVGYVMSFLPARLIAGRFGAEYIMVWPLFLFFVVAATALYFGQPPKEENQ